MPARLAYGEIERFFRLKFHLRQLARERKCLKPLYVPCDGKPAPPELAIREKAYLMQLRLQLESQLETDGFPRPA